MKEDTLMLWLVALAFLGSLVYGVFTIIWAVECGNAGGAYIIPQNSFPVCVQGVRP